MKGTILPTTWGRTWQLWDEHWEPSPVPRRHWWELWIIYMIGELYIIFMLKIYTEHLHYALKTLWSIECHLYKIYRKEHTWNKCMYVTQHKRVSNLKIVVLLNVWTLQ